MVVTKENVWELQHKDNWTNPADAEELLFVNQPSLINLDREALPPTSIGMRLIIL
jgi:hypothetical protein